MRINSDSLTLLRNVLKTHIYPTQYKIGSEFGVASWLGVWTLQSDQWIQISALSLTGYMTFRKEVTYLLIPKETLVVLFHKIGTIRESASEVW